MGAGGNVFGELPAGVFREFMANMPNYGDTILICIGNAKEEEVEYLGGYLKNGDENIYEGIRIRELSGRGRILDVEWDYVLSYRKKK